MVVSVKLLTKRLKPVVNEIIEALKSKKLENVIVLNVSKISSEFVYIILATSNNESQVNAAIELIERITEGWGLKVFSKDTRFESGWVFMDFCDIVVHIMSSGLREYYNLERIWRFPEEVVI